MAAQFQYFLQNQEGLFQAPLMVPFPIMHNIDTTLRNQRRITHSALSACSVNIRQLLESGRGCPQASVLGILEKARADYKCDYDWISSFKKISDDNQLTVNGNLERALGFIFHSAIRLCGVHVPQANRDPNAWLSEFQYQLVEHDYEAYWRVDGLYRCAIRLHQAIRHQPHVPTEQDPFRPAVARPEGWNDAKEIKVAKEGIRVALRDFLALAEIESPAIILGALIQQVRDLGYQGVA